MMQRHLGHLAILAALALALPVLSARADIRYPPAGPLILPDARNNLHLTHFVSPLDLGAVCDGVTDDATALQAWLNAASTTVGLTLPNATCAFATVLSLANPTKVFIQGAGSYQSTLLYTGAGTTPDLLTLGAIGGAATNNIYLTGFRIASNTTMTAGFALHLENTQESVLRDIVTDGLLGNGKLWGGVWGDKVADIQMFGGSLYGLGDQLRVNGCLGAGCGPKAEFYTNATRIRGKGSASVGIHIGGGFGGFTCADYTSVDMAGVNFLADTSVVNESNREILLTDGCLIDVTDAGGTDGIQVNDAGPSGGGYINIFGRVGGAVRHNINVINLKNGWLSIMNGGVGSAGTDNVRISDTTVSAIIGPHRNTSAGGYGINCTVTIPAGQIQAGGGINFSGNVSGNWGGNCNEQETLRRIAGPLGVNMGTSLPTAQLGLHGNLSFETNLFNTQKGIFWKADADSAHGSIYRALSDGSLLIDAQANIKLGSVNTNDVLIGTGTDCGQKLCVNGTAQATTLNATGGIQNNGNLLVSQTAPTIASGGCTTGSAQSVSASNGSAAFEITLGGATCGSTITLTMPAAPHKWVCDAHNITTPASNKPDETAAASTTAVVLTNFVRTTGVAGNFTGADKLAVKCLAY
jgi:hypothetical protein